MNEPKGTLFSIHIHEDEDGFVHIVCESVGRGANAHEIGFGILHDLRHAEQEHPEVISVAGFTYSESRH